MANEQPEVKKQGRVAVIPHSDYRVKILARLHKDVRKVVDERPYGSSRFVLNDNNEIVDFQPEQERSRG